MSGGDSCNCGRALTRRRRHMRHPVTERTPNASGAAKLVGKAYPFSRRNRLVLSTDNHNSVNWLREFARHRHARAVYVPAQAPELRIDSAVLKSVLRRRNHWTLFGSGPGHRKGLLHILRKAILAGCDIHYHG
jgi:hypothetical protein